MDGLLFIGMIAVALVGFVFACKVSIANGQLAKLPVWRRVVFSVALLGAVWQIVLFALSWSHTVFADYHLIGLWTRMLLPSFVTVAVCTFAGRGSSRWWLLASSTCLFILCFFTALSV